jgi:hypothetical protein
MMHGQKTIKLNSDCFPIEHKITCFITAMKCIYSAVQTEFLIYFSFILVFKHFKGTECIIRPLQIIS